MAENIVLSGGSGGDTLAADEITAVKYQRVKMTVGADGINDGDVATGNPMPTDLREFAGVLPSVTNPIPQRISDGTAFIPFPTALVSGGLNVNVGNTVGVSGTVAVTQSTTPWEVDGSVSHNAGAPAATSLLGVLPAIANAAAPTYTEGNLVLGSVDLAGATRIVAAALPLPSGAATSGAQLANDHDVNVSNASLAITAAALPLPSGAATSGAQLAAGHTVSQAGGPWAVEGSVAHDGPDAGSNPFKAGANAVDFSTTPVVDVAADDITDLRATRQGLLWTIGGSPHVTTTYNAFTAAETDTAIGPTVAANETFVLTAIIIYAGNANGGDVNVDIGYGTTTIGTVIMGADEMGPGGGYTLGNGGGVLARGASSEELRITTSAAEAVTVTVVGFIEPV